MRPEVHEAAVLENIVPELEAKGYEVYARPTRGLLPPFMQPYPPDAIALRDDKNLAIEILRQDNPSRKNVDKLGELLAGRRDWELVVYWIIPSSVPQPIKVASVQEIDDAIRSAEELMAEGRLAPALLIAWAALEALGRAFLPEMLPRPQTPAALVEAMAHEGWLTPSEADRVRELSGVYQRVLHGGLQEAIATKGMEAFAAVLRTLLGLLRSKQVSN